MTNSKKFLIAGWSLYLIFIIIGFLVNERGGGYYGQAIPLIIILIFALGTIFLLVGFKRNISRAVFIVGIIIILGILLNSNGHPKCYDCQTKAFLASIRSQAELFYDDNGESYGKQSQSCDDKKSIFGDLAMANLVKAINESSKHQAACFSNPEAWAVSIELRSGTGYFCSDSSGFVGNVTGNITSPSCASVKVETNRQ
ncbi:MAG TPA: hypothetical protein VJB69_01075 [Candidatus Paceibacterota bacterium]